MSDNSNNVHFSGVRFICSPYLAIKSALASLGPIMARCGPQMNLTPSKWTLLLYCKGVEWTQTSIFSPNTMFHSLHYSQESLRHVCSLQFSLISVRPLHCYISIWNLQIAQVTDFPGVIIITSVLFGRSKAAYWLCWYKRYVAKVFCIYRKLFRNRSQRTVSLTLRLQTWTYRNGMCIIMYVREGNFNEKSLFSQGESLIRRCSNCWKLKLPTGSWCRCFK